MATKMGGVLIQGNGRLLRWRRRWAGSCLLKIATLGAVP